MAVYVVKLRDNRFYVGYTSDFRKRLNQHLKGKSSEWVKKFKLASNPVYKIYEDLRLVICEKCGLRGHDKSICENK